MSRVRVCGKSVALLSYYSVVSTRCFLLIYARSVLLLPELALLTARLLAAGVEEAVYGGVHVAVGRDQGLNVGLPVDEPHGGELLQLSRKPLLWWVVQSLSRHRRHHLLHELGERVLLFLRRGGCR